MKDKNVLLLTTKVRIRKHLMVLVVLFRDVFKFDIVPLDILACSSLANVLKAGSPIHMKEIKRLMRALCTKVPHLFKVSSGRYFR